MGGVSRPVALILRALGLGDLLAGVPALRALARALPDHERVLALPAPLAPLALHTRTVDRVLCAEPLAPLDWREGPPDIAVNLHGRGPQSHAVLRSLSPRLTFAFACPGAPESADGPTFRADEHEVVRWCRMLEEHGIVADPSELDIDAPPALSPGDPRGEATLLHPGAGSPARRWPARRWGALAAALARAGERVVITGNGDEVALAREVASCAGLPETSVLAGRTSVMDLVRAVAAARRVVCGDTGVAHLATALRRPSVILFGPVSPALWGPPPDRPWHRALWAGMIGDPHAEEPSPGLLRIGVGDVLEALSGLPAPPARGPRRPEYYLCDLPKTGILHAPVRAPTPLRGEVE